MVRHFAERSRSGEELWHSTKKSPRFCRGGFILPSKQGPGTIGAKPVEPVHALATGH